VTTRVGNVRHAGHALEPERTGRWVSWLASSGAGLCPAGTATLVSADDGDRAQGGRSRDLISGAEVAGSA